MNKNMKRLCIGLLLAAMGCGNEPTFNGVRGSGDGSDGRIDEQNFLVTETFLGGVTESSKPVDVSFIVDTSPSMREEREQLQIYMASFITTLLVKDLDYQVFMIGDNFDFPDIVSINPRFMRVEEAVDSYNGLSVGIDYLSGSLDGRLAMRPDAIQYMVYITDDESRVAAKDFKTTVDYLQIENVRVNGLVGLKKGRNGPNCTVDGVGNEYMKLADMDQFRGLIGDVCSNDWAGLIETLANSVLEQVAVSEFTLEQVPVQGSQFAVEIDGKVVSKDKYQYDENKNAIIFSSDSAPQEGTAVTIKYYVTTK